MSFSGRSQISRHGLSRARGRSMLQDSSRSANWRKSTMESHVTSWLTGALGLTTTLGAPPLVGVAGPLFPDWPAPWGLYCELEAPGGYTPACAALSGDLPFVSFTEVVDDVGVPWFGEADCWWIPREAWFWELEESFFFDDLFASFALDNCSCCRR